MNYETNIGLEIHAELSTKTKAFCACKVSFGEEANTNCCPVCMGFPGTLPVLNEKLVEYAVKMGIALNCGINKVSKNARKNYFYPDLAKGYQITQADKPLCENGFLYVEDKKIRINRIHIEEDAGKLIHEDGITKIDYNRAGVPLIEIVTEPDFKSAEEVKVFLEKIKNILLYLEISHCKMQQGNLRCDVNVSVKEKGAPLGERCEMKNINSFSAVTRCIKYEEKRQRDILLKGGRIERETRSWDDEKGESFFLRSKEDCADYRYFPEPDLNNVVLSDDYIEKIRVCMPRLPDEIFEEYVKKYSLSDLDAENLVKHKSFTKIFDEAVNFGARGQSVANFILGDISRIINERNITPDEIPFSGSVLAELCLLKDKNVITQTNAKEVLEVMFSENKLPKEIVKEKGFTQISDRETLENLVKEVLNVNEKSIQDYKKGKTNAFGYLVGQCIKKSENRANPKIIKELLEEMI